MKQLTASIQFDKHLLATPLEESAEVCVSVNECVRKHHVHMVFSGGEKKSYWLRQSVATALMNAAKTLYANGYLLVLKDAYRSLREQDKKFLKQLSAVKKQYPNISHQEALKLTNTFVAGIPILAAHTAGAAVDVTMKTVEGEDIDMGCPYLTFNTKAITHASGLTAKVKHNRSILLQAMERAGFSNYPFEYWHFSMGDVCDAYLKSKESAIYGPIELDATRGTAIAASGSKGLYEYFA